MKTTTDLINAGRVESRKAGEQLGFVGETNLPASLPCLIRAEQNLRVALAAVTVLVQRAKGIPEPKEGK